MAILGKNNLIEDEIKEGEDFKIPSVVKDDENEISLKKSVLISAILHPTVAGLIWLFIVILAFMGIRFSIFERPKPKMNDIEFVLVNKEATPKNKNTKYRSDKNSRTGGKNDPKRKVSMPSPTPKKQSKPQKASPKPAAKKPVPKKQTKPQKKAQKPTPKVAPKPKPPSARPSVKPPSKPKLSKVPNPKFAVPVPKSTKAPAAKTYSTGPIGGSGKTIAKSAGGYAPVPSLAPTSSGGAGSKASSFSKGSSGYGNAGNPGGGGGAPGIDAIREPDFGPYMRELQRRIKMNWDPPKGNESKRVVLLFKIAKDGRLLSNRVLKTSGIPNADKAALSAVELTAPFKPLPPGVKNSSIDIQFTFDYNVFGASGYN
jgi:TonB family protein